MATMKISASFPPWDGRPCHDWFTNYAGIVCSATILIIDYMAEFSS